MDSLTHTFKRLCREHAIEIQDCILEALTSAATNSLKPILNLSTSNITPKSCTILGKVLAADHSLQEICLNDCMLSEEAVRNLVHGLTSNSCCRRLALKGNNIRGTGAETLGRYLRHNNTLTYLGLEWNSLGILDSSFVRFCDGLSANTSLTQLDLRNNQISHDGAAELATSLKSNSCLKYLDLRWNNVGLLGGRAILDMLQSNKTLVQLELAGNNVPKDILTPIDTCIERNADRMMLLDQHNNRTRTLTNHVQALSKDNKLKVSDLMNKIDQQEDDLRTSKRSSANTIGQLQFALEDRKNAFNSLAAKLSLTESELTLSQQKCNDFQNLLTAVKHELSDTVTLHQSESRKEKEDRVLSESKLLKNLSESSEKSTRLENKIDELESKNKQHTACIYDLKEQITQLQADNKVKASQFKDKLQSCKQQHKDELRENEVSRQQEINRLRTDNEETCKNLCDKIKKQEAQKLELEGEITRLKASIVSERLQVDEHTSLLKQRLKTEEEQRNKQLEDKLRAVQVTKDDMEVNASKQSSVISELQSKISNNVIEIESLKRRLDSTQQELAMKSTEVSSEVSKLQQELDNQLKKIDSYREVQSELRDKLSQSDRRLSEQVLTHRKLIDAKDQELATLHEKLKAKELELSRIKEEESQRVNLLQNAVMNYCSNRTFTTS